MKNPFNFWILITIILAAPRVFAQNTDIISINWKMLSGISPKWQVEIIKDSRGKRIQQIFWDPVTKKETKTWLSCLRDISTKKLLCVDDFIIPSDPKKPIPSQEKVCRISTIGVDPAVAKVKLSMRGLKFDERYFDERTNDQPITITCNELVSFPESSREPVVYRKVLLGVKEMNLEIERRCVFNCRGGFLESAKAEGGEDSSIVKPLKLDLRREKRKIITPDWSKRKIKKPDWQMEIIESNFPDGNKRGMVQLPFYGDHPNLAYTWLSCLRHIPSGQEFCNDDVVSITYPLKKEKDGRYFKEDRDVPVCTIWAFATWAKLEGFGNAFFVFPWDEEEESYEDTIDIYCKEYYRLRKISLLTYGIRSNAVKIKLLHRCRGACTGGIRN